MRKLAFFCAVFVSALPALAAIPAAQREALIALHNATGGPAWTERANWLGAPGTECTWARVRCDDQQSTVHELNLEQNNLRGTLPPSIGSFPDLRILFFFDNSLEGALPSTIGQLTNLEYLILDRNAFSGPIPPSIGQLTRLRLLHVDGNQFTSIPREIGNLRALEDLDLSFNALEGPIPPEMGQLTNLLNLQMVINHLSGPIPRELGNLARLEHLGLVENELTGPIPPELGDLTALKSLRIHYNRLEGTIPTALGRLQNLEELELGANLLTGNIPREITQLAKLRHLGLSASQFSGPLPTELYSMQALETLDLGSNRFDGEISTDIGRLTNLQHLSLGNNQFRGPIPPGLTTLARLQTLDILNNDLEGPIPQDIGRLTELRYVDLAGNRLSGRIPSSVGQLTKVFFFSVYENQLDGPIPPELGNLTELQTLYLTSNQLTGTIPESLRNLKKLEAFYLGGNQLSGSIPEWIGELTALSTIFFPGNRFTGEIPRSIGNLVNLESLYLGYNDFTGTIPREIGNLSRLGYLQLEWTSIGGAIPEELWGLTELVEVRMNDMALTGPLSSAIGNLSRINVLFLQNNDLEGAIPAAIGNIRSLQYLSLGANGFSGTIPREIGQLDALLNLELYGNALRGPIPPEIRNLQSLRDRGSDFDYNMLTADTATRQFVNQRQYDEEWESSQTVTPANVRVSQPTDRSALVEWDPIAFVEGDGGYQVTASRTAGGAPVIVATTSSKRESSIVVRGLEASTTWFFTVSAVSHPFSFQENLLVSDPSPVVSATTTARVVAPPDVALTESTTGLIQVDSVPRNEDSFTLTNYGDAPTTVTLLKSGTFFTVEPETFALAGGASQTVRVRSLPQPPGTYYGGIDPEGTGVGDDIFIGVSLLSAARPAGTAIAEALTTRVEVAGAPGSDSVGQARFRNRGTATLTGVVLSDQPWVVPEPEPVRIDPGQIGTVNFQVIRSRRPAGAEGSLTANLSLVYVDGATGTFSLPAEPLDTPGVSVTLVTVIDVPRPAVTPSGLPGLGAGEVAYFASGMATFARTVGRFVSDVSILNANTARAVTDLRMYFTPAGGTSTTVATIGNLATAQAVTFANVVTNVYGADPGVGTLQFRSLSLQSLAAAGRLVTASAAGTFSGDLPVFRSDRSVPPGQALYLTGVRRGASMRSDLYLQETGGAPLTARVEFLDANGNAAAPAREVAVAPFALSELLDAVPAGGVTLVITNVAGSSGRLAAYARVIDEASGDSWSIVDWSRQHRFATTDPVRIPFVSGATSEGGGSRRRRAVTHGNAARATTELTLFNPGTAEVRAALRVGSSQREVAVGARRTVTIADAGNGVTTPAANAVLTPLREGQLVVTARTFRTATGTTGTAIPVVTASSGLRLGQSLRFSQISDSTAATVAASKPGTFRTSLGLVETSGAAVTVRASVVLAEARALASSVITRDFPLQPNQQLYFENLVRGIAGDSRETVLGELHNLQLLIEVVNGQGAVVPYLIATDNGTGDSLLRID